MYIQYVHYVQEPAMIQVNVTEFRNHLPTYLDKVKTGEEVALTSRGKVVARLIPELDECERARKRLDEIRKTSWVGDVSSPVDVVWEAARDTP
jgi:prevent-host-death family protein